MSVGVVFASFHLKRSPSVDVALLVPFSGPSDFSCLQFLLSVLFHFCISEPLKIQHLATVH